LDSKKADSEIPWNRLLRDMDEEHRA